MKFINNIHIPTFYSSKLKIVYKKSAKKNTHLTTPYENNITFEISPTFPVQNIRHLLSLASWEWSIRARLSLPCDIRSLFTFDFSELIFCRKLSVSIIKGVSRIDFLKVYFWNSKTMDKNCRWWLTNLVIFGTLRNLKPKNK